MPSDSIAGFLDRAQASRVLFPEQVEQLIRQPDIPQSDLTELCSYLLARNVLTQFQADAIRAGRAHELSFGGYPVIDVIGPCPGGTAYRVLHPSLRTPLVLRRFTPGAFAPADTPAAVVHRAKTFGTILHPNLHPLVDAGAVEGQAYVVLDQLANSTDLGSLLAEVGGAMPGFLAAEYGWCVASALRAVHERGGWHGAVRPGLLFVGPLVIKTKEDGTARRRPAPSAVVKLGETGLTPVALPAAVSAPPMDVLAYLPPERVDGKTFDAAGDIYGLGACLYLLLTGRAPFSGESPADLIRKLRAVEPAPLAALRPTEPPELTALVMKMLAKRPEDRPRTAADACAALAPFCRSGTIPTAPQASALPQAVPVSLGSTPAPVATLIPVAQEHADEARPEPDDWGVQADPFADAQAASAADTSQPRRRELTKADKAKSRIWIAVGLCLHMSAVGLIVAYALGAFDSTPEPPSTPDVKEKKNTDTPPARPKTKNKKANPDKDAG
jgi:serine/threonine protein kinase